MLSDESAAPKPLILSDRERSASSRGVIERVGGDGRPAARRGMAARSLFLLPSTGGLAFFFGAEQPTVRESARWRFWLTLG